MKIWVDGPVTVANCVTKESAIRYRSVLSHAVLHLHAAHEPAPDATESFDHLVNQLRNGYLSHVRGEVLNPTGGPG